MRFSRPALRVATLLAAALLFAARLAAQGEVRVGALRIPPATGYVNDFAGVVDPAMEARIGGVIEEVRQKSGGEIVVVTLPTLQGRDASEVAREIGRQWRVGQKGDPGDQRRNTGAVVLLSMQDRKWRIETGTGAMTFITAAEAGRLGRDLMVPQLQQGNPGQGILLAVTGLAQQYAQAFGFQLTGDVPALPPRRPEPQGRPASGGNFVFVLIFIIIMIAISSRGGRGGGGPGGRRRRRGWGGPVIIPFPMGGGGWSGGGWGGGGGGGFGGFGGGGGFSGGGAGGDW